MTDSAFRRMKHYQCRNCRAIGEWSYSHAREIPLEIDDDVQNEYYAQFKQFEVTCTCTCGHTEQMGMRRRKHKYEQH